jgi:tryptophan synthase alpha chain
LSRLSTRFAALRERNERALIAYVTAGDPSAAQTVEVVKTLADAGVDAVELGLPFSDPLADGPSIQASSQRSLDHGMTAVGTLEIARAIRAARPDLPLVVMTYYNPILRYGLERYAADAVAAGVDGHIVTDLTPEEADRWIGISRSAWLDTIFLLAPTSTHERIQVVCGLATGFVYCVSRTGVTGARSDVPADLTEVVSTIKASTELPVCVGFGVSQPEHVRSISAFADGVVVGSALVDLIHTHREDADLPARVYDFAASLKAATRG